MRFELIERLRIVTEEEKKILNGSDTIDTGLYTKALKEDFKIDCDMLLEKGKLIDIRPHTRFVHFPEHTHNYIEM
ncbi:MAG: AraC family transcriptional regulator, partial [Lachnospiraceae bacterium]|nr:AraC family transcriptional regulator [Lachnospiraceae bacterium]